MLFCSCALSQCHGAQGAGVGQAYPALAGNSAVTLRNTANLVQTVLYGGFSPATRDNPRPFGMPPYVLELKDQDTAALTIVERASSGEGLLAWWRLVKTFEPDTAGRAAGMKPLTVVVLDAGGNVTAVEREDGSSNRRFDIAYGKAYGAISMGVGSRALMVRAESQAYFIAAASARCL